MKKQLLLLFVMLLLPMVASADPIKIDGIWYNLVSNKKMAEVTKKSSGDYSGSIVIPEKVTYDGAEYSVTSIGESAFYNCSSLTSVTIPNSVTSIGNYAFDGCSGLTSVHISDLEAWCKISFSELSNPLSYAHHLYMNGSEITNLVIPNSVTSIGNYAFSGCSGLTSITIPNSVTSIENNAFYGCSGLTSIIIPNSVTSIGNWAFSRCSGLTSITIPNSVTSIGEVAFAYCSGLTSITIPNSVTSIKNNAFYGCSGLTSVTIPNSVTSIGYSAFMDCSALTSVIIGNGIKGIYSSAFAKCPELTDVTCMAESVPTTESNAFADSYIEACTLHVPNASVNLYKAAVPWKNFKSIVGLDGGDIPEPSKCEKPTISYENGELTFNCATEGVEYVYEITDSDIKKGYSDHVQLTVTYNISVYATKAGYENSETATATLCWIDVEPKTEGITISVAQVKANAVLIQSEGGRITVNGVDDGTNISVYGTNGVLCGTAISRNGSAAINTNLQVGSVAIVKIGERTVKIMNH